MNRRFARRILALMCAIIVAWTSGGVVHAEAGEATAYVQTEYDQIRVLTDAADTTDGSVQENSGMQPMEAYRLDEGDGGLSESQISVYAGVDRVAASSVVRENWASYGDDYCYGNLSKAEQSLYDRMEQLCITYMNTQADAESLSVDERTVYGIGPMEYGQLSTQELTSLVYIFIYQNPQYYFLQNSVYYNSQIAYLGVYEAFAKGDTRSGVSAQMYNRIDAWIAEINQKEAQLDKEKAAHDIVCDQVVYQDGAYSQSAYSAVIEGKTVCAGYTKLYSILTNAAGLETVSVTSATHGWNRTKLGGRWYNVDTTWDDKPSGCVYTYFNKSDASMRSYDGSSRESHTQHAYYDGVAPVCEVDYGDEPPVVVPPAEDPVVPPTDDPVVPPAHEPVVNPVQTPVIIPDVTVSYRTHVQSFGWQGAVTNGTMSGTSGRAKRLEGIEISVSGNSSLGIQYTTHCQSYGWLPWSANGEMNGTEGEAKRLEAIKIQLTGADKDKYNVYYRVHAQSFGWLAWAANGAPAGTAGLAKRLEAIQIVVVKKGDTFNHAIGNIRSVRGDAYIAASAAAANPVVAGENTVNVEYRTHVQTYGWQGWKYNGSMSGTSGLAKRLEGINIRLTNKPYLGSIVYTTHVQTYGWQGDINNPDTWCRDGQMSGTSGKAKRLEAICIALTGEMAEHYDIYYRVHAQSYGWLGWSKNGAPAGTAGLAKRLEGIQIVLVPKNGTAPSVDYQGIRSVWNQSYIKR